MPQAEVTAAVRPAAAGGADTGARSAQPRGAPQRPQADTHDAAPAHDPQAPPPAPGTAGAEAPDEALLEFLGTFSTEDGQWLDPLGLDDETPPRARGGGEEGR